MESFPSISPVSIDAPCTVRPLRRAEYDRLIEMGAFEEERVELLEGMLLPMSPQGGPHAYAIELLDELLHDALRGRARIRVQMPFAASDISEPEPDIAVVPRGRRRQEHPSQAHLLIEVADSERRGHRDRKVRIYAQAGVPELWIIDLSTQHITTYRRPAGDSFLEVEEHGPKATLRIAAFPDVAVPLADLFASD